jgi:protein SCO1/2
MAIRITTPAIEHVRPVSGTPRRHGFAWLRVGYVLVAALTALVLWFAIARPVQVLPRMRPAPLFTLTNQDGHWFNDGDLRGRVVLVSFSYARCGVRCAAIETQMQAVRDRLRTDGVLGQQTQLLTISIDPRHDTPAELRAYATRLGANKAEWQLLTGMPAEVKELVGGGFGVYYTGGTGGTELTFDHRAVLIDAGGTIRAEYDGNQLNPVVVARDIALIEREAASAPIERPIYEAAHVFVCYPQ